MKRIILALAGLWLASTAAHAQTQANNLPAVGMYCLNVGGTAWIPAGGASGDCIGASTSGSVASIGSQYPTAAIPISASATGTTAATTATLAASATGLKTFLCSFSIRANATNAVTGNATITGTVTGTLNYTQWTAPLASGVGIVQQEFSPCVPSSAVNTAIAVISAAPGSGGVVSVTATGYQL
jgi:hypothetical protein